MQALHSPSSHTNTFIGSLSVPTEWIEMALWIPVGMPWYAVVVGVVGIVFLFLILPLFYIVRGYLRKKKESMSGAG
jgi:hypothetical protein